MSSTPLFKIAILGAESSGKSTLAAALAAHYRTLWVPEYLREFVDVHGRIPEEAEQLGIAVTQLQREAAAGAAANVFLFCDTTPLITALYSEFYWGRVPSQLDALAREHDYALTVVTAPDGPWVADGLMRESATVREQIHAKLLRRLDESGIAYRLLAGSLRERVAEMRQLLDACRK
jgi:NadR type nicotinamide-nucleotide adenylyltransferase